MKSRFDDRISNVRLPESAGAPVSRRSLMRLLTAGALVGLPGATRGGTCSVGAFAHEVPLTCLAFFPDGKTLISAGRDNFVKFWTIPDGALFRTISTEAVPTQLAASRGGARIAVAMQAGHLELWSADGSNRRALVGHTDTLNAVAFTRDNTHLVSVSQDRTSKLWSTADSSLVRSFPDVEAMSQVAIPPMPPAPARGRAPQPRLFVTSGTQLYLRLLSTGATLRTAPGRAFAISPDGTFLAAHDGARLYVYAFPSLTPLVFQLENQKAISLSFSADGTRLAVTYAGAVTRLYSAPELTLVANLQASGGPSLSASMDPRNRFVALASGRNIYLYSLPSGTPFSVCFMDVAASAPSANGLQYITGGSIYTVACGASIPFGYACACNCVPGNCPCVYDTGCSCDSDFGCSCDSDTGCSCNSDSGCGCVSDSPGCSCDSDTGCSCDFDYGCGCVDDYGCSCVADYGCGCVGDYGCGCVGDSGCGCVSDYGCGCDGDLGF